MLKHSARILLLLLFFHINKYDIINKKYTPYSEEELSRFFPFAYQYLLKHKKRLLHRNLSQSTCWFEYGRNQALNSLDKEKLVLSNVVSKTIRVFNANDTDVPFAGFFITSKKEDINKLKKAREIFESQKFYQYIITHSTPTNSSSYSLSVKEILDYQI